MLDKLDQIKAFLEACEEHGFKPQVEVNVHWTTNSKPVSHTAANEFVQQLAAAYGGTVYKSTSYIAWRNSQYSPSLTCGVFFEKPTVEVPAEELRAMQEELDRLRAQTGVTH